MQLSSGNKGKSLRDYKYRAALITTCLVWVFCIYKSTLGMIGVGYENLFLTRTYEWLFYSIISVVCFCLFLLLAKNESKRFIAIAGIVVCSVTLTLQVLSPVGLSTDYYRYIWQGRLSNASQDNYALVPWDAGVEQANAELFQRMDWRDVKSVYPPLAEQYFRIHAKIFDAEILKGENFQKRLSASKIPNLILFVLSTFLLYKITNRKYIAFAWLALPFIQYELVNAAHIDVLSVTLLLGAFYALKSKRLTAHILTGSLVAAAGMVKLSPFVLIVPIAAYLYVNYSFGRSLAAVGGFLAVIAATISPFIINDFALVKRTAFWFSGNEFSLGNPLYELAYRASSDYGPVLLKAIMFGAGVLLLIGVARSVIRKKLSYHSTLWYCLLFLLIPFIGAPIVLPWYWAAPLAVLFLIIGQRDRLPTRAEVLILLLCIVLILIQYVDRASMTPFEIRQFVTILSGLALYAILVVCLFRLYLRNENWQSQSVVKSGGI